MKGSGKSALNWSRLIYTCVFCKSNKSSSPLSQLPAQVIYLFIYLFFHHGRVCSIWRLKFLPLFAVIRYISHLPVVDAKHFLPHSSALHYIQYCLFCVGQMVSGMGNSFVLASSDEKLQVKEKLFLGEDLY